MKKTKTVLAALAIAGFVMSPIAASAADKPRDRVTAVGCVILTIITLPILILTGDQPRCD